jgi:putative aldouronate transport system permease protein
MNNPVTIELSPSQKKRLRIMRKLWADRYLYLLVLPGILFFIVFSYFSMYGVQLAFKKYMIRDGILGSPWVGLDNFNFIFRTRDFWNAVRNTVVISFGRIITGFPVPIILALMLNELKNKKFRRISQTVLYLPHFVSWIIVAALIYNLLSVTSGVLGKLMISMDLEPIRILGNISYIRGLIYASSVWKGAGWGTIIYLAAITSIDPTLYEAAMIDGANRLRQIMHITIPGLAFAITINLILTCGNVMNAGFDQIFQLYNPGTFAKADIIDTYTYRMGLISGRYEISTAIGLFKSVINCILVLLANAGAKALGQEGLY